WLAGRDRGLEQRQSRLVAALVLHDAVARGRAAIELGRDVRRRAGEQEAVHVRDQLLGRYRWIEHGDEHGHRPSAVAYGGDVFLSDHVERMGAYHAVVAGDADNGSSGTHAVSAFNAAGLAWPFKGRQAGPKMRYFGALLTNPGPAGPSEKREGL